MCVAIIFICRNRQNKLDYFYTFNYHAINY